MISERWIGHVYSIYAIIPICLSNILFYLGSNLHPKIFQSNYIPRRDLSLFEFHIVIFYNSFLLLNVLTFPMTIIRFDFHLFENSLTKRYLFQLIINSLISPDDIQFHYIWIVILKVHYVQAGSLWLHELWYLKLLNEITIYSHWYKFTDQ